MSPNELMIAISNDPRLDHMDDEKLDKLTDKFFLRMLQEAEKLVLLDTNGRVEEKTVTGTIGERAINLPNNFLEPVSFRWKRSGDDAKLEGFPIKIVSDDKLI